MWVCFFFLVWYVSFTVCQAARMDCNVNPHDNPDEHAEVEPVNVERGLWDPNSTKIFVVVFCKQNFLTRMSAYKNAIKEHLQNKQKYAHLKHSDFKIKVVIENSLAINEKKKYTGSTHNLSKSPWSLFYFYLLHNYKYDIVLLVEDDVSDVGNSPIKFNMSEDVSAFNTSLNMLLRWYELEDRHNGVIKERHDYIIGKNYIAEPTGILPAGETDLGDLVVELA